MLHISMLPRQLFPPLRAEETFRETLFPQQCFLVCGRLSVSCTRINYSVCVLCKPRLIEDADYFSRINGANIRIG